MQRPLATSFTGIAVIAAVAALAPCAAAQGDNGFLRGEGNFDAAFTYSVEKFEHFWVDDMKVSDPGIGKLYRESWNFWFSYGLNDDLDLVASASIVRADAKGDANLRDHSALQDGVFGAKWRFVNQEMGPGALSVLLTPAVKIPLYHYEANDVTALGDGQVDYRLRGVIQYTASCGAYAAIETGYDVRTEGTPNEIPIHVSVGATLFDRLTVTPFMSWVNSMGGPDIGQDDFPDVEEDSTRGGVGAYLRLTDHVGATAGYKTTFQGSNTGDSWSYWAGIVFRIGRGGDDGGE
jgi:hypothetical protein